MDLVLLWLGGDHAGGAACDVKLLELWLCSNPDDDEVDHCLSTSLMTLLACLAELREKMPQDCMPEMNRDLYDWSGGVDRIVSCMSQDGANWHDSVGRFCETGDRLLISMLGMALGRLTEQFSVPAAVREIADALCRDSMRWCDCMPVPPAAGRSQLPADYVQHCRQPRLTAVLQLLADAMATWDDGMLDRMTHQSDTQGRRFGTVDADELIIACEELSAVVREFLDGWPVERTRMERPLKLLLRARPSEGDCKTGTSVATTPLAFNDLAQAARELATTSEPSPCEEGPIAGEIAHSPAGLSERVRQVVDWLRTRDASLRSRCSGTLDRIVQSAEAGGDDPANDLLDLLFKLDDELCVSSALNADALSLRNRLQSILIENLNFLVLGDDLVGKPLDSIQKHVTVNGSCSSPSLPANHVISVRRPGYLFRASNGTTSLVRPAEVNVSR